MIQDFINSLEKSEELTSVTVFDAETGKEFSLEKREDIFALRSNSEDIALFRKSGDKFEPVKVPGKVYAQDAWKCYQDCMNNCGGTLGCAKKCGAKCGIS